MSAAQCLYISDPRNHPECDLSLGQYSTKFETPVVNYDQWLRVHTDLRKKHGRCNPGIKGCQCGQPGSNKYTGWKGYPRTQVSSCARSVNAKTSANISCPDGTKNCLGIKELDHGDPLCTVPNCYEGSGCGGCAGWAPSDSHYAVYQATYDPVYWEDCCSGKISGTDEATRWKCHPEWYPGSDQCVQSNYHYNYCLELDKNGKPRLATDQTCDRNSFFAKISGGGIRDKAIRDYCANNPDSEYCYCVDPKSAPEGSPIEIEWEMLKLDPQSRDIVKASESTCWSNTCNGERQTGLPKKTNQLLTTDLLYPDCPTMPETICENIIKIYKAGEVHIDHNKFKIACGRSLPSKLPFVERIWPFIASGVTLFVSVFIIILIFAAFRVGTKR